MAELVQQAQAAGLVPTISHERLSGYPLGGGCDRLSILQRIAALPCTPKILFVIREQNSWLYSAWKQTIIDGGSIGLRDFLTSPGLPSVRLPAPRLEYCDYAHDIALLHDMFGKANVLVIPMEMLRHGFARFTAMLEQFAGLEPGRISLQALP